MVRSCYTCQLLADLPCDNASRPLLNRGHDWCCCWRLFSNYRILCHYECSHLLAYAKKTVCITDILYLQCTLWQIYPVCKFASQCPYVQGGDWIGAYMPNRQTTIAIVRDDTHGDSRQIYWKVDRDIEVGIVSKFDTLNFPINLRNLLAAHILTSKTVHLGFIILFQFTEHLADIP